MCETKDMCPIFGRFYLSVQNYPGPLTSNKQPGAKLTFSLLKNETQKIYINSKNENANLNFDLYFSREKYTSFKLILRQKQRD